MASRGMDRNVRQTIPTTKRRARSSPRSSSVSSDMRPVTTRVDAQDLIEAEREYQRQQELEKCATDLAMEAMEYKFLSRRKRLMARKLMRGGKDTSDPEVLRCSPRLDSNGNVIGISSAAPSGVPVVAAQHQHQRVAAQRSVAPDLALQIGLRADLTEPELLLEKLPGAGRESTPDQSVRSKHDRQMVSTLVSLSPALPVRSLSQSQSSLSAYYTIIQLSVLSVCAREVCPQCWCRCCATDAMPGQVGQPAALGLCLSAFSAHSSSAIVPIVVQLAANRKRKCLSIVSVKLAIGFGHCLSRESLRSLSASASTFTFSLTQAIPLYPLHCHPLFATALRDAISFYEQFMRIKPWIRIQVLDKVSPA